MFVSWNFDDFELNLLYLKKHSKHTHNWLNEWMNERMNAGYSKQWGPNAHLGRSQMNSINNYCTQWYTFHKTNWIFCENRHNTLNKLYICGAFPKRHTHTFKSNKPSGKNRWRTVHNNEWRMTNDKLLGLFHEIFFSLFFFCSFHQNDIKICSTFQEQEHRNQSYI